MKWQDRMNRILLLLPYFVNPPESSSLISNFFPQRLVSSALLESLRYFLNICARHYVKRTPTSATEGDGVQR
jgi:hypothetical protein